MNASTIPLEEHLTEVAKLNGEISNLNEQLAWFRRQIFGQRAEKVVVKNDLQLLLDIEIPELPEPPVKIIPPHIRRSKNKDSNKITFPDDLPVETTVIDLKDEEKPCPETGKPLVKIGEEVSQKLAHKPGSYYIKEIIRPKYAMPKGSEETILTAALPEGILSRCKADESFLADIFVKKFVDHLPLYRQSEMLSRKTL